MAELTEALPRHRAVAAGRSLRGAFAACAAVLLCVLTAGGLVLHVLNGGAAGPSGRDYTLGTLIAAVAFGLPGALLTARRAAWPLGPLALFIGAGLGLGGALSEWALYTADTNPGSLPGGAAAMWVGAWCWAPSYAALVTLLPLLLPDGRLPSARWRPVAYAAIALVVVAGVDQALSPYAFSDMPEGLEGHYTNPVEASGVADALDVVLVLLPLVALASLASLVVRYRRAREREREQLKWVALGGVLSLALFAGALVAGSAGDWLFAAGMIPLPVGVAIAVLRHNLWDVDLVINRSLVYGVLTAAVIGIYAACVAVAGEVAGLVAVGVVAVALQPAQRGLQRAVNRLLYGDRDDPAATLRRLGERLVAAGDADEVLPEVADTVARALRLPWVEVRVDDVTGGRSHADAAAIEIELLYRGERVGELLAAAREPGGELSRSDRRALELVARQVAVAAHAVRLTADLRRSRERIVVAREEERRRLRRDLHDDLGPTLAALALELEAARDDPERAGETLDRAAAHARHSVADVRRLVHDLRPPSLDDLGLEAALDQQAARLGARLECVPLGPLPAAVEVAAFRIASEALANTARHAGAGSVVVTLARADRALELVVADDGHGFGDDAPRGVGLASMRERAEELGGTFAVESSERGTTVRATLPLEAS